MKRSVTTFMRGGVAVIEAEADIRRSAEQVFDYASDPANEPGWNIRVKRAEKLTGGPVGVGARYRMEFTQGPAAVSECVRFERPGFGSMPAGRRSSARVSAARSCPKVVAAICRSGCRSGPAGRCG
jgi:hypothetical protein